MAEFIKIENGIYAGVTGDKSKFHKAVPWCRRIFYFGTKPVTNPSRNCTNDECFRGGYLALYNMPSWNYTPFPGIDIDYNYAQDQVFPVLDNMYMLCYSKFDGFYFYGLYRWQDQTGGWKEASVIKNGDHTMSRDSDCSVCTCYTCDQESAYLAVYGEKTDHLKVFQIKKNTQWEGYIDINNLVCVDDALGYKPGCIIKICTKDDKLYGLIGAPAGCHCTFDPCKLLTVCLTSKTVKVEECQGENGIFPPFTNGPQAVVQMEGKWIVVGGKDENSTFVPDIWTLDLATFQWSRSGQSVPQDLDAASLTAVQLDGVLFLGDNSTAIYNYQIADL